MHAQKLTLPRGVQADAVGGAVWRGPGLPLADRVAFACRFLADDEVGMRMATWQGSVCLHHH